MMTLKLVLLTYENRSGSTLLAKELNSTKIVCCPESDVLMNIILESGRLDLDSLLNDYKFEEWGIQECLLKTINYKYPLEESVFNLLSCYVQKISMSCSTVVIKGTDYLFITDEVVSKLERYFSEVILINLNRDIYSVYNSQVKSIHSNTGIPMENNVVKFYNRIHRRKLTIPAVPRVLNLHFEEFIKQKSVTINKIYQYLGYKGSSIEKIEYTIGNSQHHLHSRKYIDIKMASRQVDNIGIIDRLILRFFLTGKLDPKSKLLIPYQLFCFIQWKLRILKRFVF